MTPHPSDFSDAADEASGPAPDAETEFAEADSGNADAPATDAPAKGDGRRVKGEVGGPPAKPAKSARAAKAADADAGLPTPMVRHYLRVKAERPDQILLYRIGDFYETFGEDAVETSRILNITLTKKHIGSGRTLPLAGIPYHALETYLGKLIRAGKKVAICEQIEDAREVKGRPVDRAVVRVVTPGTVIEESLLPDKAGNFLAAVARHGADWGLACCELSTGSLAATRFDGPNARLTLLDELARLQPAELIGTEADLDAVRRDLDAVEKGRLTLTRVDAGMSRLESARGALLEQFRVQSLQGFGAEELPAAICAAGALVIYLKHTQMRPLGHIARLEIYTGADYLTLDAVTQRSLELTRNLIDGRTTGTLLETLDHTKTPMGGRLLRQWIQRPLQDPEAIGARQEAVASLLDSAGFRDQVTQGLSQVRDLERLIARVHMGAANARDLITLARSLREVPSIKTALMRHGRGRLAALGRELATLGDLADLIESTLTPDPPVGVREGGMIRDGCDARLDELREIARGGKTWINRLRQTEIERSGIASLKIGYNRVFGYYIEVTKGALERAANGPPADWERRQTLSTGERYVTPELKEKEALILGAEEKINDLEFDLFEQLRRMVSERSDEAQGLAARLAEADALASLARAALIGGYTRPEIDGSDALEIKAGRHPVVEAMAQSMGEARPFVPNDVALDTRADQIWLITGPNMAGKSTFIRQVALITLMAHMGSFVPARSARIGLVDRIFTRVGATDYLTRGQSTFLVEMTETANILNNATPRSLIILDEIGRGTSTYDGLSIAWAVLEHLHEKKSRRARTLFATHYHELAELEGRLPRLKNYNVAVREQLGAGGHEEITFLYQIVAGRSDHSYGIHAARLAGVPVEVVARARQILFELECARAVGGAEGDGSDGGAGLGGSAEGTGGGLSAGAIRPAGAGLPAMLGASGPPIALGLNVKPADSRQLDMFSTEDHPIVAALRKLDAGNITPIQALQILDELIRASKKM